VVNNIQLPANKKNIIKYENKIAVLDGASMQKFREASKTNTTNEEIKVIPELHVEAESGTRRPNCIQNCFYFATAITLQ
jgi:protein required for attachment to host cells